MFGVMCQELRLTFSFPWFIMEQNQQIGTIYHRNNPSQTNASVSSNEEDSPLWRTGRNPQNVDLNQWPTEAGSVLFRLVILSSPKGKEPLLTQSSFGPTHNKFEHLDLFLYFPPHNLSTCSHNTILGDTVHRRDSFLNFSHLWFKISPFLVQLFPIFQVIVM